MSNLSIGLALDESSAYRETNKIIGRTFYFDSTSTDQTYVMKMPVGTRVRVDGTRYKGADDDKVIAHVTHTGRIEFIESVPGCIYYFELNSNKLSGTIPNLSLNVDLTYFVCHVNQLTGNIPDLSANTLLKYFSCYTNQLSGNIPNLSSNTALEHFAANENQLDGDIPDLRSNTSLKYFSCSSNQLTGNIPDLSTNTGLHTFSCENNQLVGSIPDLSGATALQHFYCFNNKLTGFNGGTIKVTDTFDASDNLLTVEAVDGILQALVDGGTTNATISLQTGNGIPTNTTAIATLRANGCTVTVEEAEGRIFYFDSTSTSQTYNMRMPVGTRVSVDGTWYDGADSTTVTANVTHAGTIEFIESVPGCIEYFVMNDNQITDTLPDLSLNVKLSRLYCHDNQFSGELPSLSANPLLWDFYCYNNQFTGSIPNLSSNTNLRFFHCSTNKLTGDIPDLSANTALTNFYCSGNQLTGFAGGIIKVTENFLASNNLLTVSAVDAILDALVAGEVADVIIRLEGGNGVPTNTEAIAALVASGCTVTVTEEEE